MPKVSVIVPIYNVEKYLRKCLDSIVNQTLKDIEIILVDDGSTDNSGNIVDEYEKKDNRIRAIHKENGGQGSARNSGLKIASGEYVGFVDSDDWIDSDMYENLYTKCKELYCDVAVCSRKIFNESNELVSKVSVRNDIFNIENIPEYIIENLLYPQTVSTCNKIYRKSIIDNKSIKFEDVKNVGSEDTLFNYCILLNSKKIVSYSDTFYNGVERKGSTTREYKIGAMNRTAGLIEKVYFYSKKYNREDVGEIVAPILLLFFQQWNYNLIKTYGNENIKSNIKKEHIKVRRNMYFKKAEKNFIFSIEINKYIKKMGYSVRGIIFIKLYMLLSWLGISSLAAKIRTIT